MRTLLFPNFLDNFPIFINLKEKSVLVVGAGDIALRKIVLLIKAGKNITVIAEVIAMDTLMKLNGIDTAGDFNNRLRAIISNKEKKRLQELKYETPDLDRDLHGYE